MLKIPFRTLFASDPQADLIYVLLWILVVTVLIQSILLLVLWRRMPSIAKQGGEVISKAINAVRRTLVGGGKRGKPLASIRVVEGPPNMIGQELKIYTESIKLGRNPQVSDMTFYGPEVNSSISGLHARIDKVNGLWRIVALSQSRSETFVDDHPMPFNEPVLLQNGQMIRMGYFAQQPVILEFCTFGQQTTESFNRDSAWNNDVRKTDIGDTSFTPASDFFDKPNVLIKAQPEDTDSVFDEFR